MPWYGKLVVIFMFAWAALIFFDGLWHLDSYDREDKD